jgi:hypothetical protein
VGALSLILRSQVDNSQVATSGIRMVDLFPVKTPEQQTLDMKSKVKRKTQTPPPDPTTKVIAAEEKIEVIRGIKRTME